MKMIYRIAIPLMLLAAAARAQSPAPTDAEIRRILAERVDERHNAVGMVVAVIEPSGTRIVAYGKPAKDDARPLNGDTVFEIGSITKVFTVLLLADMAQRGEVKLDDPIAKYLPEGVKAPQRNGKQITLEELATHTSSLPRLPNNFSPKDAANPYADYSADKLYAFLNSYQLPRDPGEKWEYSNLATGLLGHLLSLRAGKDYETLVVSRIATPLGMASTRITLTPEMKERMAAGYNAALEPTRLWDFQALAGGGALRSTANDLIAFLAANLGYKKSPLQPAMAAMLEVRIPGPALNFQQALGWHIMQHNGRDLFWKDGGTYGFASFIGFDAKAKVGVVVLANSFSLTSGVADEVGLHLLDTSMPLAGAPVKERQAIAVDPKILEGYVGRYQLAPTFFIAITREDDRLYEQATGQPKLQVFAESEKEFFLKGVDAQITFKTGAQGRATELTLHQNGLDQRAPRME
ncbi:MAG: serine hydrolase [Bryobacteraceae bacterium]|jgi:CubicO group peptidase (beta-lactamase class C family)